MRLNLLAIETATNVCGTALYLDGSVQVELTLNRPRAHAENLVPLLADTLRYGGISAQELDAVGVSAGPGSYTGLRIGASTAKGLAAAVDAALIAVPSLEALAYGAKGGPREYDVIVAAFDARRDEVFAAAFQSVADEALLEVRPADAVRSEDAAAWLGMPDARLVLVGDGAGKFERWLIDAGFEPQRCSRAVHQPRAGSVAVLAAERFVRGDVVEVALFEPLYLKPVVATKPAATAFEKLPF